MIKHNVNRGTIFLSIAVDGVRVALCVESGNKELSGVS